LEDQPLGKQLVSLIDHVVASFESKYEYMFHHQCGE
jgi:hypothetical protein